MRLIWNLLLLSAATVAVKAQISGKDYDRIVIIVLENQDYSDCVNDAYLSTIAENHNGVLLTNYMALTHPSQPNYIGLISGSTDGVNGDSSSNIDRDSIVDLLEAKGISWKAYQEAYPDGGCNTASSYNTYRRKHNPFISFTNIAGDRTRCAKIVPATQLDTDISNNSVPQFVFYTPDMNNDGHDTSLGYASYWLKSWLEPRITKSAFTENTLFVLTWDENKTYAIKNQVMTVLFGPAIDRIAATDGTAYNHYSVLKSIEENVSRSIDYIVRTESPTYSVFPIVGFG
ncbi:phosphoesterase family-domain-containing protein [Fennellomyces sp. T-0311]|nr:phosphoesterase family-domain-containing protein [Fennellomyces sp. T-0311]